MSDPDPSTTPLFSRLASAHKFAHEVDGNLVMLRMAAEPVVAFCRKGAPIGIDNPTARLCLIATVRLLRRCEGEGAKQFRALQALYPALTATRRARGTLTLAGGVAACAGQILCEAVADVQAFVRDRFAFEPFCTAFGDQIDSAEEDADSLARRFLNSPNDCSVRLRETASAVRIAPLARNLTAAVKSYTPGVVAAELDWEFAIALNDAGRDTDLESKSAAAAPPSSGTDRPREATVNARMTDLIHQRPECVNWTVRQFAEHLDCSEGAVVATPAWDTIMSARAVKKVERLPPDERQKRGRRRGAH